MADSIKVTDQSNEQSIKRKKYVTDFRQKYPEESKKLSDAQILTIFDKKVDFVVLKEGLCRIFDIDLSSGKKNINDYYAYNKPKRSMELSVTGRYGIYDYNKYEHSYYAADGTKLKESYFRKAEEKDRMNRPVKKAENNYGIYVPLSEYRNYNLDKGIEDCLKGIEYKISKAEKENGLFASLWSGIKNKTGWGDSSNKAREQLKKEREIIAKKGYIDGFTAITGLKATPKNIEDFKNGKVKLKSEKMLEAYKEGQEMAVDIEGDLISGAAAFGVYSAAVIAAPFTAGASIAAGAVAAAGIAAVVKPTVKIIASEIGGYEYEGLKKDAMTGAFSGVLAPISAGLGGAVGKTVAKRFGVEAVKHIGKKGVEQTAKAGLKETIKTGMLNPAGFKYTSNSFIRREIALGSELVTDGVMAGTIDGGFRAGVESGWSDKEMGRGALMGSLGGLILSPVIGRTMRTTGKIGHKMGLSTEESIKLSLKEIEENASPVQKAMIEELRKNDEFMKSDLICEKVREIFNPNRFEYKILGQKTSGYLEVNEVLKAKLNVLKFINDSPEILDDAIFYNVFMYRILCSESSINLNLIKSLNKCDLKTFVGKISSIKKQMLEHPEMYVNGEYFNPAEAQQRILNFWHGSIDGMAILTDNFDNETLGVLMRRRLDDVNEYLQTLQEFTLQDMQVLKKLANSVNIDNTHFSSNQKIEFIDLIQAYKDSGLDISLISNAVKDGKADIANLHKILLNKVFKKIGMSDEDIASIPKEKLAKWDIKYIHLLAQSVNDSEDDIYKDLIKAANTDNFIRYIHDTANDYGKANAKTKELFTKKGWDYEAYIKPAKENEVKLVIKDQNVQQLADEGSNFVKIIEQLMQPPMDKIIKKQLSKYIKDDKFVIPEKTLKSKEKLHSFMEGVLKNLDNIKKRAEGNLSDPQKATNAKNMVTKFEDMKRILESVKKINTENDGLTKNYDLTIKMIDRNPQKDIFQGNYSTCCIGQGQFNGVAMANYLMNTAFNMIELVDNKTGKTIGNALCYFVEDKKGNPYFIIDNIEINNAKKCSEKAGTEIRDAITEYASRVVKQITGKDDVHICMGNNYNDVSTRGLHSIYTKIKLVGDVETDHQYMDLLGGWVNNMKGSGDLMFLK